MPDYDLGKVVGEDGSDAQVTIDSSLSSTSTNPVQNKVIKNALDGKQGISTLETAIKQILYGLDYNTSTEAKFNYAIIKKTLNTITYEELWILSNAYYDYTNSRFVKIDINNTSFGIQIQANGAYPGAVEAGNTVISVWRNPKNSEVTKDTSTYNYADFDNNHYIGAKRRSDNVWVEFGISSGWNSSLMMDSYGRLTIDGNEVSGVVDVIADGDMHAVTSNAVYDAIGDIPDMSQVITKSSTAGLVKNDGSIDTTTYSATGHSHSISDVTNLQSTLNGKASTSHTHDDRYYTETEINSLLGDKADASDLGAVAFSNDYDDLDNIPSSFTPSSHTHAISDVTNLQTSLDAKVNTSDIANNLTTTTSGKVLDARQGKALADLIGDAIVYINM